MNQLSEWFNHSFIKSATCYDPKLIRVFKWICWVKWFNLNAALKQHSKQQKSTKENANDFHWNLPWKVKADRYSLSGQSTISVAWRVSWIRSITGWYERPITHADVTALLSSFSHAQGKQHMAQYSFRLQLSHDAAPSGQEELLQRLEI